MLDSHVEGELPGEVERWYSDVFEIAAFQLSPLACRVFQRAPHHPMTADRDDAHVFITCGLDGLGEGFDGLAG